MATAVGEPRPQRTACRKQFFSAAVILLTTSAFLLGLWYSRHFEQWFRESLAALDSHNWELLQYRQLASPQAPTQEAVQSLFTGALKLEQGDFDRAMRMLQYAVRYPSTRSRALVLSAEASYAQNDLRGAEHLLKQALQFDPLLAEAQRWMAIVYYDMGLMSRVLYHLENVARLDPHDPRPHRVMGVVHMDRHGPAVAVEDFEESLRRDPNQPDRDEILLELAEAQLALNRFNDALETLANCPPGGQAFAMQAECRYSLGDASWARQFAEESLQFEPMQRLAIRVLAKLALDNRRYDEAIERLLGGIALKPADYDLRYLLLTALRAAGRTNEAEEQARSVDELERLRDKFDELLEEAVARPYNANLRYELGVLADRLDMRRSAEAWFRAAVALDSSHIAARTELQRFGVASPTGMTLLRGS